MNKTITDIKYLLSSVSEGNRASFTLLYNLYYEQVFRFSYYFLKEKEACREVVSDVFFAVWQSRKKLADIVNIETYFYVVAKNECNRYLNRNRNYAFVSLDEIPVQLEHKEEESPEDELQTKEIETLLTQVIAELPEKCRLIFLMTRQDGLKPKEIATILSINESTVRVQIKIAIEKIITRIKPFYPNLTLSLLLMLLLK